MVKMRLKHLKIEFLKVIGRLDKSVCINCEQHLYDNRHRCKLYLHKVIDYIYHREYTEYELCNIHNDDGNCPFFENKFNNDK